MCNKFLCNIHEMQSDYCAHLLGQPCEEVPAPEKVQDEVELSLGLEGVVQLDDERVLHLRQDVALHLGADPITDWKKAKEGCSS